jgi:hypothetical protein
LARYALLGFVRADLLRSRFRQAAASAILEVAAEGIGHRLPTKYLLRRARLTIVVSGMNARMRTWIPPERCDHPRYAAAASRR